MVNILFRTVHFIFYNLTKFFFNFNYSTSLLSKLWISSLCVLAISVMDKFFAYPFFHAKIFIHVVIKGTDIVSSIQSYNWHGKMYSRQRTWCGFPGNCKKQIHIPIIFCVRRNTKYVIFCIYHCR